MTDRHSFKPLRAIFALEPPFGLHFDEPRVHRLWTLSVDAEYRTPLKWWPPG